MPDVFGCDASAPEQVAGRVRVALICRVTYRRARTAGR